jgi:hypothetical protein
MKSKKEIEQLAIKHANLKPNFDRAEEEYYNSGAINAYESFMHGYTQCQQDMADVMEDFLEYVRDNYTGFGAPHLVHNKGGQRKTKAIVEDFINSLNKQELPIINGSYGCTIETLKNKQD